MSIPIVPYEGRMSYCLVRSLAMVLGYRGHSYPVPWLECVSGESFGFIYIRNQRPFFAINGFVYHEAGQHLLQTLNYTFSFTGAANDTLALAALREALVDGPVAVGMLDMGYLTYFPDHIHQRGADHAIVILALQEDHVVVHDPAGFTAVPLPIHDFLAAWQRDVYTGVPYGLWRIGDQGEPPTEEEIWRRTIDRAYENVSRPSEVLPNGTVLCYGPEGMRLLARDLQSADVRELGSLPYFNWRVSAQRCLDSAIFLRERLPNAAAIRWDECQSYGQLQYASAVGNLTQLPDILDRLADQETAFMAMLAQECGRA